MPQNHSKKLIRLVEAANEYGRFYCKFVTANDVGLKRKCLNYVYKS